VVLSYVTIPHVTDGAHVMHLDIVRLLGTDGATLGSGDGVDDCGTLRSAAGAGSGALAGETR
jgi:hypothetical protein